MDESVLVNNPPQNERKLIEVMLKYREEKGMPIDSLCSSYIMAFYEYTESNSVYLKQNYRNDINGVTYRLHEDKKYALGSVVVSPSETESCKWSVYVWLYYN